MIQKRKRHVGFAVFPERSSINSALCLAKVIRDRGHSVTFFGARSREFQKYVANQGYDYVGLGPDKLPDILWHSPLKSLRAVHATMEHFVQELEGLPADSLPDLFVLDILATFPAAVFLSKFDIPTVLLIGNYGSRFDSCCPPVFSQIIVASTPGNWSQKLGNLLSWWWTLVVGEKFSGEGGRQFLARQIRRTILSVIRVRYYRKVRQQGWQVVRCEWGPQPILPEIVIGHQALDWPALAATDGRHYLGSVDIGRHGGELDWGGVTPEKPRVYCSISTLAVHGALPDATTRPDFDAALPKPYRPTMRFLDVVLEAFATRPDWQLMLSCGPFAKILRTVTLPPNIEIHERVPQLRILSTVNLAINWGGAATLRECVQLGVPMLIFPAWSDQFGNAARVVYHGLGLRGDLLRVTPEKMIALVERVLGDENIAVAVSRMQRRCDPVLEAQGVVDFFARHLSFEL